MMRFCLRTVVVAFTIGIAVLLIGNAHASESWLKTKVSPRISQLNEPVNYKIDPPAEWQANTALIHRVDVLLHYHSDATVLTQLCLATSYRCVTLNGNSFTTDVFNDEPINSAFFLVHTVTRWNGADPNLFIRSSVSVWAGP